MVIPTHGGLSMTDYTPLIAWYSHERAAHIYDVQDDVHKRSVARRIVREYGQNIDSKKINIR